MNSPEHQADHIRRYFLGQSSEDTAIKQLEKVASHKVLGRRHDIWDVHASDGRWWVITDMTNLYSQEDFPSLDQCLTFHIGLCARIVSRQHEEMGITAPELLPESWRRFRRVVDAIEQAEEAEDYQTVGMRCREALLALVREAATDEMVPGDQTPPKRADFVHWSEHLANYLAFGPSAARMRSYLKASAKETWEYVNWLTHARNTARYDAEFAVDATFHILGAYGVAIVRFDQGSPERCPECGSYRMTMVRPATPSWL